MRKVALALVGLAAFGSVARAETSTLATSGFWRAFGGSADNGSPVCGVQTNFGSGRVAGSFLLKWFYGQDFLTVQLFHVGWAIPAGAQAPVTVVLDGQRWNVLGKASARSDILEFYVLHPKVRAFLHDFTAANTMLVTFDAGTAAPWTASLRGDSAVMGDMVQCVLRSAARDAPTPFDYARDAQPFAAPYAATSQPFAADQPTPAPPQTFVKAREGGKSIEGKSTD